MLRRLLLLLALSLSALMHLPAQATATLTLTQPFDNPVGKQVRYLVESNGPLTPEDAWAALQDEQFVPGQSEVVAFGIGAPPVWLHLQVENPRDTPLSRVLSVETAWLDEVVFYFRHEGQ